MNVEFDDEQDDPAPIDELARLAQIVMKAEGLVDGTMVSITLVDEATIAGLNEAHLGNQGPTDVVAFPIEDTVPGTPPLGHRDGPPVELGDVFIAPSVVRSNAQRSGVGYEDEMALMVVHGLLHLLGWDHAEDDDAVAMEKREGELLGLVGRERR